MTRAEAIAFIASDPRLEERVLDEVYELGAKAAPHRQPSRAAWEPQFRLRLHALRWLHYRRGERPTQPKLNKTMRECGITEELTREAVELTERLIDEHAEAVAEVVVALGLAERRKAPAEGDPLLDAIV